jgi:hypothetical protein
MRDSSKSSAVIDSWTVIISASGISFTRVHSYAYPKRRLYWPGFAEQRDLNGTSCCYAIGGPMEDCEAAVALAAWSDDLAGVLPYQLLDEFIMASQCDAHRIRVPDPGTGTALDIGEQKSKCPGEQSCRVYSLTINF